MSDYYEPGKLFPAPEDISLQVERENLLALAREISDPEIQQALEANDQLRLMRRINTLDQQPLPTNDPELPIKVSRLLRGISNFRDAIFRYRMTELGSSLDDED